MTVPFPEPRTAVLTAAASARGIGRATAHYLAERGWHIGIIDLDAQASARAAGEVAEAYGVQALGVAADVTVERDVRAAVDELESHLPQLVGLVTCAGVASAAPYLEVTPLEWERVISVNLTGTHWVARRVAESLVRHEVGRLVGISSVSAQRGGGTYSKTAYSAAKAGVIGLMRSLARELGPYGITANVVAPGPIDTDIMGGPLSDDRKAALAADGLLARIGSPRDVAAAVAFLLSEDTGFITGHTLNVNGGLVLA